MTDRFVALDFETANSDFASICQVGAVTFQDGTVIDKWGTLVNPEDYFDWINVNTHGIDESSVIGAPTFKNIVSELASKVSNQIVVTHTSFDRAVLAQALVKHGLHSIPCIWLDSARVVRRAWEQFSRKGYGLGNVCKYLEISFNAHEAVEDARAAGEVLIRAIRHTGIGINEWLTRVDQPINPKPSEPIAYDGNPNGFLYGEEIVFTGTLTIPRREAAILASKSGCDVATNVTKKTTLLVVGDQDVQRLAGHEKSTKHRKAEELIKKGQIIRVIRETDFVHLINSEKQAH
jgi:DNA polymerase-3 subunit epsilon